MTKALPDYMMVSETDGALYDTRDDGWSKRPPLRANYRRGHRKIKSIADLKAALRAGCYTSLGCYPLYFIASDGAALSFDAVKAEIAQVMAAVRDKSRDGWRVVACDINYENSDLYCAHTGEKIESAYGE